MESPVLDRKRGKRFRTNDFNENQKVKGILFFLYDKGFRDAKDEHLIIRHYCIERKIELPVKRPIEFACVEIQKDFNSFREWFKVKYIEPRSGCQESKIK